MKIFYIGLPKTGTHSLTEAMKILGFKIRPLEKRFLLKAIVNYEFIYHTSTVFDYKEHAKNWPEAKFILTVREPESFRKSALRFWNKSSKGFIKQFYKVAQVNGRTINSILSKYNQYNQEVQEFFNGTGRLLVMDLEAGDGWNKLCKFVDKPIPARKFPHEMRFDEKLGLAIYKDEEIAR